MVSIILRILAIVLLGLFSAFIGFIIGSNVFIFLGLELFGREGYEAGGPVGFVLGALIGLIGSSMLLFRKRAGT